MRFIIQGKVKPAVRMTRRGKFVKRARDYHKSQQDIRTQRVTKSNDVQVRRRLETLGRQIKAGFSYTKVGGDIRDDFRRRLIEDGFHLRTTEDLSRAGIYGCPQTTEDLNREDIPSALENSVGNYLVTFGAKPCTSCVIHLNWNHEGELTAKLNDFANNYVPPLK